MTIHKAHIIHFHELDSTNAYAKKLLEEEHPLEGTIISTDFQTSGKGQESNAWESESGKNILMTMILYPQFVNVADQFSLSMVIALGIIDFLKPLLPDIPLHIKWPNDIYANNKKIGGILINNEVMGEEFVHVIAGIGINLNQTVFPHDIPNPTSLSLLRGKEYSVRKETLRLCDSVMGRYHQLRAYESALISSHYHERLLGRDEWRKYVYLGKNIDARIIGVNEYGNLILETDNGKIVCDLKEIRFKF